jgi:hypothetical protein
MKQFGCWCTLKPAEVDLTTRGRWLAACLLTTAVGWMSCLSFNTCVWCVDGGVDSGAPDGSCGGPNLWPVSPLGLGAAAECTLDAGLADGGGFAFGSCTLRDGGQEADFSAQESLATPAAGTVLCARLVLAPSSTIVVGLELNCTQCPMGSPVPCTCDQEGDSGCQTQKGTVGALTTGPFVVPVASACPSIQTALRFPEGGGTLDFTQAWVWTADPSAGCVWNAAAQCPAP